MPEKKRRNWKGIDRPQEDYKGGAAPPGSIWQCRRIKRNGERCRRWSLRDQDIGQDPVTRCWTPLGFCAVHRPRKRKNHSPYDDNYLPMFYKGRLTTTLEKAVKDSLSRTNAEQVELYEELALVRHSAGESVKQYGEALELLETLEAAEQAGHEISPEAKLKAKALLADCGEGMAEALKRVEHFATAIARIESISKDKVTIHTLNGIVKQSVRLMYEVCGVENQTIAERFEKLAREKIVIPTTENNATGTNITPDADVLAMDAMIPSAPTN